MNFISLEYKVSNALQTHPNELYDAYRDAGGTGAFCVGANAG